MHKYLCVCIQACPTSQKEEGSITDTDVLGMPMVRIALLSCPHMTWKQGCHDLLRRQTDSMAHCWVVSLPCGVSIAPGWQGGKFLLFVFKAPNLWYGFRLQLSWSSQKECSAPLLSALRFCCFFGVQPSDRTVAEWISPFGQPQKTNLVGKLNCFYHSEPAEFKHLAPIGYGRDDRDTAVGNAAVANHLFSRTPLF